MCTHCNYKKGNFKTVRDEIKAIVDRYINTIVLDVTLNLGRLEGFDEDESDYYYIIRGKNNMVSRQSAVGRIIGLVNKLDHSAYKYVEECFNRQLEIFKGA